MAGVLVLDATTFDRWLVLDARACHSVVVTNGFARRIHLPSIHITDFPFVLLEFRPIDRFTLFNLARWNMLQFKSKEQAERFERALHEAVVAPETVITI